jgi:MoaA/NifB/PqqE/SkfB family radical SAM enzyme
MKDEQMNIKERISRHISITKKNYSRLPSPPFLILFITSTCNMKCEHCFYWRNINKKDDLTKEELFELSKSLGHIENLSLSGGEPFIRKEFAEVCHQFIRQNGVRQIYVPTNGYFTEQTVQAVMETLQEKELDLFVVELSLDGMPEFHDAFRATKSAFVKAIETYDALAEIQQKDPRLRIHSVSTATDRNMDEIKRLTAYLFERCSKMDHHNLAIIRGDRKNHALTGPSLEQYKELYRYIRWVWAPRERNRYGAIVEPMLQWTKVETIKRETQVVPCRAGILSGVVYANGDVSLCELHKPLGNLHKNSFWEIWNSDEARNLRKRVACKECWCTTEMFMWPSIVFQPLQLMRVILASRVWQKPRPLGFGEKADMGNQESLGLYRPTLDE